MADNINIVHQQFETFTGSAFNVLFTDQDFTDVTLVCEEDKQVAAHKVILSFSSKLFRRILLKNSHQHPLLYLKGVDYENLQLILQFIYLGQIELESNQLQNFIQTAKELEVNGLTGMFHESFENDFTNSSKEEQLEIPENISDVNIALKFEMSECDTETESNVIETKSQHFNHENPMNLAQNTLQCNQCEEIFQGKRELMKHIRVIHEGFNYPLTHTERVFRYREKRRSQYSPETLKEMNKIENNKKKAYVKAKRLEDKEFDQKCKDDARERTRRSREKKALEKALAERKTD